MLSLVRQNGSHNMYHHYLLPPLTFPTANLNSRTTNLLDERHHKEVSLELILMKLITSLVGIIVWFV